jgi:predicted O-methyltransferase YrrM
MSDLATRWYDRDTIEKYARNWTYQKNATFVDRIKPKTMLHQETLTLLDYFAREARQGILEIGPYTGYSTVVMAKALTSDIPMMTVEVGGSYDHPQLPSSDIVADLRKNLALEGVSDRVCVIEGHSNDERVKREVRRHFPSGRKIDLLVIDADGHVGRDISAFEDLLADGAVIMCDDYDLPEIREHDGGAELKKGLTSSWLDDAVRSGLLMELGVYKWATWFGQYVKR